MRPRLLKDFGSGQPGRVRSAMRSRPAAFLKSLYRLRLDANCLGMGCLGQFDIQDAIFQRRTRLRGVNVGWQVNDP